jgi:hypothetical protein
VNSCRHKKTPAFGRRSQEVAIGLARKYYTSALSLAAALFYPAINKLWVFALEFSVYYELGAPATANI